MIANPIVIVDDDRSWAQTAAVALRNEGFEVLFAEDGISALDMLSSVEAALVILDVHLPRMNGIAVLRELRKQQNATPVLMISADNRGTLATRALAEGASSFLHKPMSVEMLVRAVRRFARQRQPF